MSLRTGVSKALPEGYMAFLERAIGGEGFIGGRYICLWKAEELIEMNRAYKTAEFFRICFSLERTVVERP